MPDMDGLETIRRLRALPDTDLATVPVIAITALAMPGDREQCLAAGMDAYVAKPCKLDDLMRVLAQFDKPQELPETSGASTAPPSRGA